MADKDMALAIMQACVALAGLILVYSAFLISKAANLGKRGDKFLSIAKWGMVPVVLSLLCAEMGIRVLLPGHWGSQFATSWLLFTFEIVLALTGGYAIIAGFMGT